MSPIQPIADTHPRVNAFVCLGLFALMPIAVVTLLALKISVPWPAWTFITIIWIALCKIVTGHQIFSVDELMKTIAKLFKEKD